MMNDLPPRLYNRLHANKAPDDTTDPISEAHAYWADIMNKRLKQPIWPPLPVLSPSVSRLLEQIEPPTAPRMLYGYGLPEPRRTFGLHLANSDDGGFLVNERYQHQLLNTAEGKAILTNMTIAIRADGSEARAALERLAAWAAGPPPPLPNFWPWLRRAPHGWHLRGRPSVRRHLPKLKRPHRKRSRS